MADGRMGEGLCLWGPQRLKKSQFLLGMSCKTFLLMSAQKKTLPDAGFFSFSLVVFPCFHSEEKLSSLFHLDCCL